MNVLILGSGAREHALTYKLSLSPLLSKLYVAPGNPGTSGVAENVSCSLTDHQGVIEIILELGIELLVVGPEVPLAEGITNLVNSEVPSCLVFGPTKEACQLEWSKGYAKDFMVRYKIPTAGSRYFKSLREATSHLEGCSLPIVIKTDGLAAGKGVVIAFTEDDIQVALTTLPLDEPVVVEEFLHGRELSLHLITDGDNYHLLELAEDHKQLLDGDKGPNTGGMGTYSPLQDIGSDNHTAIQDIVEKTLAGLKAEGASYRGVIFIGLMLTPIGLKVLEYNCRFGDPETQVMLMRLQSDLLPYLSGAAAGQLPREEMSWSAQTAVCVVACGGDYPSSSSKGVTISGIDAAKEADCLVFHAGTALQNGQLVTAGGRILSVVALGEDLDVARAKAYDAINHIHFEGMHFRRDIGKRLNK